MLDRRRLLSLLPLTTVPAALGARAGGQRLALGGTGMALAAMRVVGQAFVAKQPDFMLQVTPSLGTSGGIAAVSAGAIDFALVARPLNEAERARGLSAIPYARTPIAFVTHPDNAATGISLPEVARLLKGEMPTWPDGVPVRLVRRELSDADWTMLRGLSPTMAEAVDTARKRPGLLTVGTDQENADALLRMRGSFGMVSLGQLRAEALRLKPLALDGMAPDVSMSGYPLVRTLHIAWSTILPPPLNAFLDYLLGAEGQAILVQLGHATPGPA